MHAQRAINEEPIPGYRLLEPIGQGGFGEVWKCEAPGGLLKAVKFVRGSHGLDDSRAAEQELRSLQHVKSIRHPFLLSIERVEVLDDDLVIVMELADKSLHDLLQENRAAGRNGIPRHEALAYLRETAEVLDLMNQEHGLQHLDVKPRNLFLVNRHIKVADFGLVNSLAELVGQSGADLLGAITPLYAAPETFHGRVTLYSDQYSLAATYMELVAGALPYKGKNMRQLLVQMASSDPDLDPLEAGDRAVVARALSKEPRDRFASCLDFIEALEAASVGDTVPRVRTKTTSFDLPACEVAATGPDASGVFRRQSRVLPAVRTPPAPSPQEVLAGYRLQECLNRGSLGELWRSDGPRGEPCLVRFLTLPEGSRGEDALGRLVTLRHAVLPELRLVGAGPGRVALISGAGESSLAGRLKECQAAGLPGVPREELLACLGQFAHALDELYHHHQVQHLALSPRHLALCRGEPLLLEFGLAELLMLPLGQEPATLNPRYAAPELFDGLISDACDQYGLALMYQELLVGLHPFRTLNARQLASSKMRGQPELSLLPAPDRAVVLQALSVDPENRFRSCREFVLELEQVGGFAPAGITAQGGSRLVSPAGGAGSPPAEWVAALEELVQAAGRGHLIQSDGAIHYRLAPGTEIEQHTWARLPAGMARLKLDGFREQHRAEVLEKTDNRWLMEVPVRTNLLLRCFGRTPGLLVEVSIGKARESAGVMTPVRIRLEPRDCGRGKAEQVLAEMGPVLLASLQAYFSGQSTRRAQERYPLAQAVHVQAAGGLSITAQTRDVGREEMTVLSPCELPADPVRLTINRLGSPLTVQIPGRVRDCAPCGEGQFEVTIGLA